MQFSQLIKARKSIRGYLQKPVPREVIEEIIEVAKWAPSSMNTQPWHVHVVTGSVLDRIRQGNSDNMLAGVPPKRDFPMKEAYEGVHRFDLGAFSHAIVLAAWERGLGCVINGQGIMQSKVVREHAQIPDDQNIMICIAMGYPDASFVANDVKSVREDNATFVRYLGFDETENAK